MMDCERMRDELDAYLDGELPAATAAEAEAHLADCPECARAARAIDAVRTRVRLAVRSLRPPDDLEYRLRQVLRAETGPPRVARDISRRSMALATLAVTAIVTAPILASTNRVGTTMATLFDRAALSVSPGVSDPLEFDATIVCRDCELEHLYSERVMCARVGHRGALATPDGRIWNIVEQPGSAALVRDSTLLGKAVRVRARLFRNAGSLAIDRYTIIG